ncbi:hypothetical protein BH09BAC1_BH09BAC1_28310 [soil metagenome]
MKRTVIFAIAALTLLLPLFTIAQVQDTDTSNSPIDDYRSEKLKNLPYKKKVKIANGLYENGSYINALMYYEEAYAQKPENACIVSRLAKLNYLVRDYGKAETYYGKFYELDPKKFSKAKYMQALMQKYNGKYDEAKKNFQAFIGEYDNADDDKADFEKIVKRQVEGCELGIKTTSDPERVIVTLLDEKVNNPFSDFAPIARENGELVYSSLIAKKAIILPNEEEENADSVAAAIPYARIYTTQRSGDTWLDKQLFPAPITSDQYHVGNGAFSKDGNRFYFTQCMVGEALRMECEIYVSVKKGGTWDKPVKLDINKGSTTTHPSVGVMKDGKEYLFFSSTRVEGEGDNKRKRDLDEPGNSDLYYAEITGPTKVGAAKNLGSKINTKFNEVTPFYDNNTHILYFSSEGYVSIGGFDIYKAVYNGTDFDSVTNLLAPINSSVDDLYYNLSSDGKNGFLVSNRPGGYGLKSPTCCDDIYSFKIVTDIYLKGIVANKKSPETPIDGADVSVFIKDGNNLTPLTNLTTNSGKPFIVTLDPEKIYQVNVTKSGYWGSETVIDLTTMNVEDTLEMVFLLEEIQRQKIQLKRVYYDFDRYNLTKQYKVALDTLAKLLLIDSNKTWTIEIYGHTDSIGSDAYNMVLAKRRAQTCADYLQSKKVDIARISLIAVGESQPAAPNTTANGKDDPKGRAKNRRAEFKINTNNPNKLVEIEYTDQGPYVKYSETKKK